MALVPGGEARLFLQKAIHPAQVYVFSYLNVPTDHPFIAGVKRKDLVGFKIWHFRFPKKVRNFPGTQCPPSWKPGIRAVSPEIDIISCTAVHLSLSASSHMAARGRMMNLWI